MTDYNKVFLDTAPIICFLEKSDLYYKKMRQILQSFIEKDTELFTSALSENCDLFLTNDKQLLQFNKTDCKAVESIHI